MTQNGDETQAVTEEVPKSKLEQTIEYNRSIQQNFSNGYAKLTELEKAMNYTAKKVYDTLKEHLDFDMPSYVCEDLTIFKKPEDPFSSPASSQLLFVFKQLDSDWQEAEIYITQTELPKDEETLESQTDMDSGKYYPFDVKICLTKKGNYLMTFNILNEFYGMGDKFLTVLKMHCLQKMKNTEIQKLFLLNICNVF